MNILTTFCNIGLWRDGFTPSLLRTVLRFNVLGLELKLIPCGVLVISSKIYWLFVIYSTLYFFCLKCTLNLCRAILISFIVCFWLYNLG